MNTIKLNDEVFTVINYNKNVSFSEGNIYGSGSCSIRTLDASSLDELAKTTINSIKIYHDEELIYQSNSKCTINSISEYLNENAVDINIGLSFNYQEEEEPEPEPEV